MGFLLLAQLALSGAARAAPARIEVVDVLGALTAGGNTLVRGEIIDGSSPVELAAGGEATLRLEQGLVLLKGPASFTADRDALALRSGSLLSVLKKLKRRWSVKTPAAVAAVRGTTFYVEARPEETYVCLCEGKLALSSPGREGVAHVAAKHHTAWIIKDGARTKSTMLGHTDAEIAALKARL